MAKPKNHTHKLRRHKYPNGSSVYFCILNCTFKVEVPLALGKEVLCNLCNNPFMMTEYHCKLARPHCNKCSKKKVINSDGTKSYVRPGIMQEIAEDNVSDLKNRLASITTEKDQDL